jgi:hypothetical protein
MTAPSSLSASTIATAYLDEINSAPVAQAVDLIMMTMTGGRERTCAEYRTLRSGAHFQISRAIPVTGHIQIIEAFPA